MPRDPKDTSVSGADRGARRLAEALDIKEPAFLRSGGGPAGAEGPAGEDGATWLSGTTVPSTELGVVGDFYLRTTTSDVYKKTGASTWTLEVNIKGATGATGESGPEGPAGAATMNGYKEPVRAATTANIATATALNPGDSIDGVVLAENDRVLVKDQSTKSQNGIWVVKAVPVRATDADAAGELSGGTMVYVEAGTVHGDRVFRITTDGSITPGTTAHDWAALTPKRFTTVATATMGAGTDFSPAVTVNHNLGIVPDGVSILPIASASGTILSPKLTERTTTQIKFSLASDTVFGAGTPIECLVEVTAS